MNQKEIDKAMAERWERKEAERVSFAAKRESDQREADRINGFVPTEFAPGLFTFLIQAKPCVYCGAPTAPPLNGPFPSAFGRQFHEQANRAGIRRMSHWHDRNQPVCVGCKNAGTETFECSHCGKTRPLSASHASYGDPAEHLCVPCYETVPAKKWAGLVEELEEQHRYDFE